MQTDGTVACWGFNDFGQTTPPSGTFSQVSAGNGHTCGLQTDGTVACWGFNGSGQAKPPGGTFSQVSAGSLHTCGVQTDGTVACWGDDTFGEATPPSGTFSQLSAGTAHTCGLEPDQSVACWGALTIAQSPAQSPNGWTRTFNNYCTRGPLITCATVRITALTRSDGQLVLTIRVRNLEGTNPRDNSGGSRFNALELKFGDPGTDFSRCCGTLRFDGKVGGQLPFYDAQIDANFLGIRMFGNGIAGCHAPPPVLDPLPHPQHIAVTCPSQGFGGVVVITVVPDIPTHWGQPPTQVTWRARTAKGNSLCDPGVNCFSTTPPLLVNR